MTGEQPSGRTDRPAFRPSRRRYSTLANMDGQRITRQAQKIIESRPLAGETGSSVACHLQDLVLESATIECFLSELAAYSALRLSRAAHEVCCGITVVRRKKAVTEASSNDCARAMDEIQNGCGEGPRLTAMREFSTVHVPDLRVESRWPEYSLAAIDRGIISILAVPLPLVDDTRAALALYSAQAHGFSGNDVGAAAEFARRASKSLMLALRTAQLSDANDDMAAAMRTRTAIDLATGAIMAQNRCSQAAAFAILKRASNVRNVKLHDIAARVIASVAGDSPVLTYFDE